MRASRGALRLAAFAAGMLAIAFSDFAGRGVAREAPAPAAAQNAACPGLPEARLSPSGKDCYIAPYDQARCAAVGGRSNEVSANPICIGIPLSRDAPPPRAANPPSRYTAAGRDDPPCPGIPNAGLSPSKTSCYFAPYDAARCAQLRGRSNEVSAKPLCIGIPFKAPVEAYTPPPAPAYRPPPPVYTPPPPPVYYGALAAGLWNDSSGSAYVQIALTSGYKSRQSAEKAAVNDCVNNGGRNCRVRTTWTKGCLYATTGKDSSAVGYGSGATAAEATAQCRSSVSSCKTPIKACN